MIFFSLSKRKTYPVRLTAKRPYETEVNPLYVTHKLEIIGEFLLNWFNDNIRKANPGKYHLLLSGNDFCKKTNEIETISTNKCEKHLGIKIDNNLNFIENIDSLCKKSSQKINALS